MAYGVENYPNIDLSDPTNYPNGCLKDDPAGIVGTPCEKLTLNDYVQFFYKLLVTYGGLTASNTPDNATDGYQYIIALITAIRSDFNSYGGSPSITGAWISGGTPTLGNGLSLGSGTIVYNKIKSFAGTVAWQLQIANATITGTPAYLTITAPSALTGSGGAWKNAGAHFPCSINFGGTQDHIAFVVLQSDLSLRLYPIVGDSLSVGTTTNISISIMEEFG